MLWNSTCSIFLIITIFKSLNRCWEKVKIKLYIIKNICDVTYFYNLKVGSVSPKNVLYIKTNQLVELYKNASVVNYLACINSSFISVVTTFIFIFNFNIVSIYDVKLLTKWKWEKKIRENVILVYISIKKWKIFNSFWRRKIRRVRTEVNKGWESATHINIL